MCVICTDVVWLLSPAVAQANKAICKLTSWNAGTLESTTNINSPRRSDNADHHLLCRLCLLVQFSPISRDLQWRLHLKMEITPKPTRAI